jgi:hypothetical protein
MENCLVILLKCSSRGDETVRLEARHYPKIYDLDQITAVTDAVTNSATTPEEIIAVLGLEKQQRMDHLQAAPILGFIRKSGRNKVRLTNKGKDLLDATVEDRKNIITRTILGMPLIQRIILFLEAKQTSGCNAEELRQFICAVTDAEEGSSDATDAIVSWLQSIHMLKEDNKRYYLGELPKVIHYLEFSSVTEPLLPDSFQLSEYIQVEQRFLSAKTYVRSEIRSQRRERRH